MCVFFSSFFYFQLFLNAALRVGPNLSSPLPLYNLVAARGDRLVPAGRVILHSLELYGDFSYRVPVRTDEAVPNYLWCCREVLLKDVFSAGTKAGRSL